MPTLESIVKSKLERLNTVPAAFESTVEKSQKQIFNDIIIALDKLSRKDGFIEMTTENLILIDEIAQSAKASIIGGDYINAVKEFSKEFDKQSEINIKYFDKAFGGFTETEIAKQALINSKTYAVELLVNSVDNDFVLPLKELLNNAVSSGASWTDTFKDIRKFAEGDGEVDGKLLRYSKQIASDSFATSDRSYTNLIAEDIGAEWFLYSGGEIAGTREFCHERNDRFYHKKEVEGWAKIKRWDGKVPSTNEHTIFVYAGGYQCKHSILPVSVFIVPKTDIERNYENGNYKPSDYEKTKFNL